MTMITKPTGGENATCFAGRYRVISTLGAGGMATVYLAMDKRLDRLVAVKVIHSHLSDNKKLIERFKIEARTVASLHSPYIVEIHDFGVHEGNLFFVMEYIDGQTLNWIQDRLNSESMDPDVASALICQIAEGLLAVVEPGIVHRDLKPENILISSQGYLKITDFGIVHLKDQSKLTSTGQVLGTPRFMSPEQVRGKREVTHQSDLFSLGTIFYYCLTGRFPFQSDSVHKILFSIADEPHVPVRTHKPDVDPHLEFLVETLLQKDPKKRGGGAHWLQSELKKYLFKRQVIDPVARIKGYIAELSARGIQTVREIDWLAVEIEMKRHNEKKNRTVLARYSTFRGQMTRLFDKKSKWLWGVFLFLVAMIGFSGQLLVREYLQGREKVAGTIPAVKETVVPKPPALDPLGTAAIPEKETMQPQADPAMLQPDLEQLGNSMQVQRVTAPPPRRVPANSNQRRIEQIDAGSESTIMAKVSATSSPPFAEVIAGDQSWGFCPLRDLQVKPGRYRIRAEWRNSRSIDTVIQVVEGGNRFQFNLKEQ